MPTACSTVYLCATRCSYHKCLTGCLLSCRRGEERELQIKSNLEEVIRQYYGANLNGEKSQHPVATVLLIFIYSFIYALRSNLFKQCVKSVKGTTVIVSQQHNCTLMTLEGNIPATCMSDMLTKVFPGFGFFVCFCLWWCLFFFWF